MLTKWAVESFQVKVNKLKGDAKAIMRSNPPPDVREFIALVATNVDEIFGAYAVLVKEVTDLRRNSMTRTTANLAKSAMIDRLLKLKNEGKIPAFITGRWRAATNPSEWINEHLKPLVSKEEEQYVYTLDVYRQLDMNLYNALANRRRTAYKGNDGSKITTNYNGGNKKTKAS